MQQRAMLAELATRIRRHRAERGIPPTGPIANEERRIVLGDDCTVQ